MDEWDSVINFEAGSYEEGKKEGINDANATYPIAFQTGILVGFDYGVEIAFIKGHCEHYASTFEEDKDEKILMLCQEILQFINSVPPKVHSSDSKYVCFTKYNLNY